jgi:hypothetical protein
MSNSTSTTNDNSDVSEKTEAQITADIASEHARIMALPEDDPEKMAYVKAGQERFDAWATDDEALDKAQEVKETNDDVLARAQSKLSQHGFSVDPDKVAQTVVNSEVPDQNMDAAEITNEVVASAYGDKLNNVGGGATQEGVNEIIEQVGAVDASRIKDLTLHGHTREAGEVLENSAGPTQDVESLKTDTQEKLNDGEALSEEEKAAADVLDLEKKDEADDKSEVSTGDPEVDAAIKKARELTDNLANPPSSVASQHENVINLQDYQKKIEQAYDEQIANGADATQESMIEEKQTVEDARRAIEEALAKEHEQQAA